MLPFVGRNPRLVWAVLLATLLGVAAGELIGALVPRDRPPKVLGKEALEIIGPRRKHDAFPSGHTTTIFLAVALWVRVVPQLGWRLLLVLLAVAVGTSRVVVGVHWPTDVLAGAALGWCWGHLAWVLSGRWTGGLKRAGQLTTATILLLAAASLYGDDSGFDELLPAQLAAASVGILMGLPGWWRLVRGVSPDGRPPSPGGPPPASPSSSGGPAG